MPLDDEHRARREEGLQGVRNILWAVGGGGAASIAGSFTREDFMNEAFLHMKAAEQVFIECFVHVFILIFFCPPLFLFMKDLHLSLSLILFISNLFFEGRTFCSNT